jgi:hypothetical protein
VRLRSYNVATVEIISVNGALDSIKQSGKVKCLSLINLTSINDIANFISKSDKFSRNLYAKKSASSAVDAVVFPHFIYAHLHFYIHTLEQCCLDTV